MGNRYLSKGRRESKRKQWSLLERVVGSLLERVAGSRQKVLKYAHLKRALPEEQSESFEEILRLSPAEFEEKIDTFPEGKQELLQQELFKISKEDYLNLLQRHFQERKDFEYKKRVGYEKMRLELAIEIEKVKNRYKEYEEKLNQEIQLLSSCKENYSLKFVVYALKGKKLPYQKEGRAPVRNEMISLKIAKNIQRLNEIDRLIAEKTKIISSRYDLFKIILNEHYNSKREKMLENQRLEREKMLENFENRHRFF